MRAHGFEAGSEVIAGDVRFCAFVGERFDEDELVRVLQALRPFEEKVAGFGAGRLGEGPNGFGELLDAFGFHVILHDDEDHSGLSFSCFVSGSTSA